MVVARAALDRLASYDWPGNVRELENVIERAVVLAKGDDARRSTISRAPIAPPKRRERVARLPDRDAARGDRAARVIHATLSHTRGDKQLAAQLLGISARTIYRKLGADRDD